MKKDFNHTSNKTINTRKEIISQLIDDAINKVKSEIDHHKKHMGTDATVTILKKIYLELEEMQKALDPKVFMPTYNYIIRDSWDSFPKLGTLLLKVIHEYKEKLD